MPSLDRRFLLGLVLIACHRHAVQKDNPPERETVNRETVDRVSTDRAIVDPKIAAMFKDTAPSNALGAEGKTYNVQRTAERQALNNVLTRERRLWQAGKPANYRLLFKAECFCPGPQGWLLMEIRTGRPSRAWDNTGRPATRNDWTQFSIDQLFDGFNRPNDQLSQVQIAFDERFHYPRYLRTSMIFPDGWSILQIRALQPIRP